MFNEFQQGIIVTIAIVEAIIIFYLMLKRCSISQTHSNVIVKNDIPEVVIQEKVEVVPEIVEEPEAELLPEVKEELKPEILPEVHEELEEEILPVILEEPKIEPISEVSLHGEKEEIEFIAPVRKDIEITSKRKSDKIIPKRAVPAHGKITKQSFSEFAGERILVAEDNPINQKVLLGLLAGSGIELVIANDGQEVLDILKKDTNFLMILMDAHMPRVDGFEATRIIRENTKYDHILVVALSGDTASDDIHKMKNAGMSEHLEKPLRMESLYKIIYAYTRSEVQNEKSTKTITTKNLDVDKGLQACGEDDEFYREILSEFRMNYANSSDKLGEFLRSGNIKAADALLLDIIGIAANIGADPLYEIASSMKLALSDTHEQSYFILFDHYNDELDRLMGDIREYL
ncbi:MAG: response regulator [Sulfuricurvum sp.]|uniref:response regulator n=1 Tax=Sulfuricurvum sp. TaxID=2025608 RepID=UPI00262E8E69|nr:response regulator [Sulfuricurvum sp.]MDD2829340.1 response regulator [Sulfuricurvum sp.]MDD4949168.1 response regulator [Sulfuricurvum sp.]